MLPLNKINESIEIKDVLYLFIDLFFKLFEDILIFDGEFFIKFKTKAFFAALAKKQLREAQRKGKFLDMTFKIALLL